MAKHKGVELARALRQVTDAATPRQLFRPTPAQDAVARDLSIRKLVKGDNRSGKSYSMAWEIASSICKDHPYRQIDESGAYVLCSLSRQQCCHIWGRYLLGLNSHPKNWFGDGNGFLQPADVADIRWDHAPAGSLPKVIRLTSGNTLLTTFHGAPRAWELIQGMPILGAYLDEAGNDVDQFVEELILRLLDARSISPVAGYIHWAATETTACEAIERFRDRANSDDWPDYSVHTLCAGDNPALTEEAIELTRKDIGDAAASYRLGGGTGAASDQLRILAPFWDDSRHIREEPYQPSDRDNVYVVYDAGISDAAGLDIWHVHPDWPRQLNLVHSIRKAGFTLPQLVKVLLDALAGRKVTAIIYDSCGGNKREHSSGRRVIDQFMELLPAAGFWQGDPWKLKGTGQIDKGVTAAITYLESAPEVTDYQLIQVDPPSDDNGIARWINEIKSYRLTDRKWIGYKLTSERIYKRRNESPDCLRYIVSRRLMWADLGPNRTAGGAVSLPCATTHRPVPAKVSEAERVRRKNDEAGMRHVARRKAKRRSRRRGPW